MTYSQNMDEAPLMLSVSGARGIVGRSMTPLVAMQFAAAYGMHVLEKIDRDHSRRHSPVMVLARDSRPSGAMLADAARAGLLAVGCDVIDIGVAMTPTAGAAIQHENASGGMVITASHNSLPWNGLKCLDGDGAAPPADQAHAIIERFRAATLRFVDAAHAYTSRIELKADQFHVNRVLRVVDVDVIRRAKLRVALDSVNGAGCAAGHMLLEQLGCAVIQINGEPTGRFAHAPEPTEANLDQLRRVTCAESADVGFAQDPDGDRLAIVDERGHYVGEEYTLVLAAMQWLDQALTHANDHLSKAEHDLAARRDSNICLAANLSTSRMIDDVAARYRATVVRTPVGEGNVVAGMKQHHAVIGGEGNGGVILPEVCWVRDSLSAMALVLNLLARRGTLSSIVSTLPRYVMIKHTFDLRSIGGADAVAPALASVTRRFADAQLNTSDGVRIDLPACAGGVHSGASTRETDGGDAGGAWVHLRPSNTEPLVRLIAEAPTRERAWELIDEVAVAAGFK